MTMQQTPVPAPSPVPQSRRQSAKNLAVVVVAIVLLIGGLAAVKVVYYGFTDGVASGRVHYCGWTYFAGSPKVWTLSEVQAFDAGSGFAQETTVGKAPWLSGDPVLAPASSDGSRAAGQACSEWVWVQTGQDAYQEFDLSGGP